MFDVIGIVADWLFICFFGVCIKRFPQEKKLQRRHDECPCLHDAQEILLRFVRDLADVLDENPAHVAPEQGAGSPRETDRPINPPAGDERGHRGGEGGEFQKQHVHTHEVYLVVARKLRARKCRRETAAGTPYQRIRPSLSFCAPPTKT